MITPVDPQGLGAIGLFKEEIAVQLNAGYSRITSFDEVIPTGEPQVEGFIVARRCGPDLKALGLLIAISGKVEPVPILPLEYYLLYTPCPLPFKRPGCADGNPLSCADGDIVSKGISGSTLTVRRTMSLWADVLEGD